MAKLTGEIYWLWTLKLTLLLIVAVRALGVREGP